MTKGTPSAKKVIPVRKLRKARRPTNGSSNAETETTDVSAKPEWLPEAFNLTRIMQTHVSGWVNTEEELVQVLANHSAAFSCKFVTWYRGRGPANTVDSKRIAWKREDIEPGCPFAIDSYLVRHCSFGLKLKRLADAQNSYMEVEKNEEMKDAIACHARLKIRRVTLYDGFRVSPEERSKKVMCERMLCVKQLLSQGQTIQTSCRVYVQLPLPAAHKNHVVPQFGEMIRPEVHYGSIEDDEECMRALFGVGQEEISFDGTMAKGEISFDGSMHKEGISFDGSMPKEGISFDGSMPKEGISFDGSMPKEGISFDSSMPKIELEVKDVEDDTRLAETATARQEMDFQVVNLPFGADASSDTWKKVEQSFFVDAMNNVITAEEQPARDVETVKEHREFKFEVRPRYKRSHILSSCKVDCPARIKVKRVSLYESFRVEPGDSRRKKDDKMLMLKDLISSGGEGLLATSAIFMQLPLPSAHRNHQISVPLDSCSVLTGDTGHLHGWLPSTFNLATCGGEYLTGWVRTEEEYLATLESHRNTFGCSFLSWSNDKERTFKAEADRRVMWKKDFVDPGCPLTVHHSLVLACAYSNQSKGSAQTVVEDEPDQTSLSLMAVPPSVGENIIQVPPGLMHDGTSLEIQYCDTTHQLPELQSLMKQDGTYIILVEGS